MNLQIVRSCVVAAMLLAQPAFAQTKIVLDDADSGRVFEGIGAVSAGASTRNLADYPEKLKSEVLDYMFKPKFGANLQHLKVEIGGGENSTCGSEPTHVLTRDELANPVPRGYEFWLMTEARKRNPKVILDCLPWAYPNWVSGAFSQDSADWFVAFLDCAKNHYGLKMDWISAGWNEKGTDLNWVVKQLRPTLDARGYADVKLQGPDDCGNAWSIFDGLEKNPEANKILQAVGYHYSNDYQPQIESEKRCPSKKVIATGKPLWDSEEFTASGKTWQKSVMLAQIFNKNYIRSRITKAEIWSLLDGIYPGVAWAGTGTMQASAPWSGHYEVWPAVWTTAHTTQFVEPGWVYMDKACVKMDPATWKATCVAMRDPKTGDWSLIVCTDKPTSIQVQVAGKLARKKVFVWKSNATNQFVSAEAISPTGGSFTASLEGDSVYTFTTTTGQRKGAHPAPPPVAAFPLPYKDDFESYAAGLTPKYTSDQKGSFETAKRADGKGMCLKQIVPKEGITWTARGGDPFTVLGDQTWTNYTVQTDVMVAAGNAGIGGRYSGWSSYGGAITDYSLILQQDGKWSLMGPKEVTKMVNGKENRITELTPLATGKLDGFTAGSWHTLALGFKGNEIRAGLDGKEVACVQNDIRKNGMIYLISSYQSNCFDNVSVTP